MKPLFRMVSMLILLLLMRPEGLSAQSLPKCAIERIVPDSSGNMLFIIKGDKDFYIGNAQFMLYAGKSVFTLNDQDGERLTFYVPVRDFNSLPEGSQLFLKYGDTHQDEDEELLSDACRQNVANCRSLGLFSKDMLHR